MKRHLSAVATSVALTVLFLIVFAANAFAANQVIPTDETSYLDLLRPVYDAFQSGHRVAAGALALIAAVALLKRYAGKVSAKLEAFLHTDVGGAATTLVLSFLASVAAADSLSWGTLSIAGSVGIAAIGGYTIVRKLVVDRIVASAWYAAAPGWVKTVLSLITWIGSKPVAVAVAEKSGAAAVAAAPSAGADGVAGPATRF